MSDKKLNKERLASCRKQLGITKMEAAKRMSLSQPGYLRYESGERQPSIHVIQTMADVLGTSAAYLLGDTADPKRDSYIVREASEPELFHMIDLYRTGDPDTQTRLLAYLQKFYSEN